jgi:hypothetical protein
MADDPRQTMRRMTEPYPEEVKVPSYKTFSTQPRTGRDIKTMVVAPRKVTAVRLLQSHSSRWMKTRDQSLINFYWQDGYGAFSVNPAEVETVVAYINNQQEHHKTKTFQQEYRAFLNKYKVEYDERYVWD